MAQLWLHIAHVKILINTINTCFVHVILSSFISKHQNISILPSMKFHTGSEENTKLTRKVCTEKRVLIQINKIPVQSHNWHPPHNFPQTCGGRKSVCPIWILPTYNFLTRPGTSFRINEHLSSKCNKHMS